MSRNYKTKPARFLNMRLRIARLGLWLAGAIVLTGAKALPKDHPTRIYMTGRVCEGRNRMLIATGAAPCESSAPKEARRITRPERVFAMSMWMLLLLDFFGFELDIHLTGHNWLVLWPGTFGL